MLESESNKARSWSHSNIWLCSMHSFSRFLGNPNENYTSPVWHVFYPVVFIGGWGYSLLTVIKNSRSTIYWFCLGRLSFFLMTSLSLLRMMACWPSDIFPYKSFNKYLLDTHYTLDTRDTYCAATSKGTLRHHYGRMSHVFTIKCLYHTFIES